MNAPVLMAVDEAAILRLCRPPAPFSSPPQQGTLMKLMDYGLKPIDFQNAAPSQVPDGFSRRGFVMTSLASGFAVASNPVLAQAITSFRRPSM